MGSVDLRTADRQIVQSVLLQPKRLALFAFLTLEHHRTGASVRRDSLAAMFWPDSTESRARNSLSQSLTHLRRALGEGIIQTRGQEEVGLSLDGIRADAVELQAAAAESRWADVLELYGGPLLHGFHLPGAPEFDHWLEDRRRHLHEVAAEGACVLGDAAERTGQHAEAICWSRRLVALMPTDEAALRSLLTRLADAGERVEAVRVFEAFADRFESEYGLSPSPETRALLDQIRTEAAEPASAEIPESAPEPADTQAGRPAPAAPPVGTYGGEGTALLPRRGARRLLPALVLAAVSLAGMATVALRPEPSAPPEGILIAPLENRTGDPELDRLGELAADWVTLGLQEVGFAGVIDPIAAGAMYRSAARERGQPDDLGPALAAARKARASIVLWGRFFSAADSIVFHVQIASVDDGRILLALEPVAAPRSDPRGGAERLRELAAGALASLLDSKLVSIAPPGVRPPTLAAYKEYARGLEVFQFARYPEAVEHFEKAAALDTTFSLPLIWAAFAQNNRRDFAAKAVLVERLARRRDRLGVLEQYALDYFEAAAKDDLRGLRTAILAAARLSPGSNWSFMAGVQELRQNRTRAAIAHFGRVDPERGWARAWPNFWARFAEAYHLGGEYDAELRLARRCRSVDPGSWACRESEVNALIGLGRVEEARERLDEAVLLPLESDLRFSYLMSSAALELRAHGFPRHSRAVSVQWLARLRGMIRSTAADSTEEEAATRRSLYSAMAEAALMAERWAQTTAYLDTLAALDTRPDARERHVVSRALVAARQGEVEPARRALPGVEDPVRRALLAAQIGEHALALRALEAEFAKGQLDFFILHLEPDLDPLLGYPPFQEFVRPAGSPDSDHGDHEKFAGRRPQGVRER